MLEITYFCSSLPFSIHTYYIMSASWVLDCSKADGKKPREDNTIIPYLMSLYRYDKIILYIIYYV